MNEKIENLMYQAGLTASGCWDKMDDYDRMAIEKFAELIIKDCIDLNKQELSFNAFERLMSMYTDRFGVKE